MARLRSSIWFDVRNRRLSRRHNFKRDPVMDYLRDHKTALFILLRLSTNHDHFVSGTERAGGGRRRQCEGRVTAESLRRRAPPAGASSCRAQRAGQRSHGERGSWKPMLAASTHDKPSRLMPSNAAVL